jgi:hypothetical protein
MKKCCAIFAFLVFLCGGCAGGLHLAAAKGDIAAITAMLDRGANINDIDIAATTWGTPLHFASKECQVETVKLLLEKGVDVNISAGHVQWTALRFAADKGCNDVVTLLLEGGAEIDARDRWGNTPLMAAATKGQLSTVKLLIEKGAETDNAIGRLGLLQDKTAAHLVETAVKDVRAAKAPVSTDKKGRLPALKSDIDEPPFVLTRSNQQAYALVIGIEEYRQNLPHADYANHDAAIVASYLVKTMGYPEENVVILLNDRASYVDLVKYIEKWLPNNVENGSSVFIYFSGHGAPNPKTGDAYLVPYDGDPSFIDQTGYSLKRMYDALGRLQAKEIIVALDSCFSGAGGRSVIAKGARPLVMNLQNDPVLSTNMTVLSASAGDQISSTYDEKGHGLFTYFMLKGIKNEDVVNPDGSIRMDDLFGYIKPQVERISRKQYNNEQTPQLMGGDKR